MSNRFRFESEKNPVRPTQADKIDSRLGSYKTLSITAQNSQPKAQSAIHNNDQTESERLWQAAARNEVR
jgi:hypothetical protein